MDRARAESLAQNSVAAARWVSLGLGTLLLAAPAIGTAAGLGDDRRLVRVAGAVDLTLGLGLSVGGHPEYWMVGRVAGNVIVGAISIAAIKAGGPRRGRSIGLLMAMVGFSVVDGLTVRQLRRSK